MNTLHCILTHPLFNKFWAYNYFANEWMAKNYTCILPHASNYLPVNIEKDKKKRKRNKKRKVVTNLPSKLSVEETKQATNEEYKSESFKLEINDTWIEYTKIHQEHAKEREQSKKSLSKKYDKKLSRMDFPEPDYIDIKEINQYDKNHNPSSKTPLNRPFENRHNQLLKLYGKHASTIAFNETALQGYFDEMCQKNNPTIWPIIPFEL